MIKSKTKINKQVKKKSNSELVETIKACEKHKAWMAVAGILSGPTRKRIIINLDELNKQTKDGENILVPGKVLSQGEISKKIKIYALAFSENAKEKLLKSKCEVLSIIDEIKKNPDAKNLRIIK